MSVIFLILLLVSTSFQDANAGSEYNNERHKNGFIVDAVIRELFEMFKEGIKNGDGEKGIPVLDPYQFENASFELSEGALRGKVNVINGTLFGLGDHQLGSFHFTKSDISIQLELHFPFISISADNYEMAGKFLEVLPIAGRGIVDIEMINTTVKGKIFLKQSDDGKSILLRSFKGMHFTIESIKSDTEFDNNIDGIINTMTNDLLAEYLTKFSRVICAKYGDIVVQTLNTILNKLENWYIIVAIL